MNNSPGGTINLKISKLNNTPARKMTLVKIDGEPNQAPDKKIFSCNNSIFTHNNKISVKGKSKTSIRLSSVSASLCGTGETNQSQDRTDASGGNIYCGQYILSVMLK